MMSSLALECYENLRRDVKQIFSEEHNLVEEDEYLVDSIIANSNNPDNVLEFARGLKEEGNVFFKEGKLVEALENYGFAGVALVRCKFEKDEDKMEFFDLAISILLNLTACLGRKNEFILVGQVCSIILEYMPRSVKALFRRAKAARALGRSDLAYCDLIMAADIEPKNGEVQKAIEEIKNSHGKDELKIGNQGQAPIGLGLSLPLSKKKSKRHKEKDQIEGQDQLCGIEKANVVEHCDVKANLKEKDRAVKDTGVISDASKEGEKIYGVDRSMEIEDNDLQKTSSVNEVNGGLCELNTENEKGLGGEMNGLNADNSNQAESKYRFVNRRRPGSSLSISKNDLQDLMKGKTLFRFNAKQGSSMTIRVVASPAKEQKKGESLEDQKKVNLVQSEVEHNKAPQASDQIKEESMLEDFAYEPKMEQHPLSYEQQWSFTLGVDGNSSRNMKVSGWKRKEAMRGTKTHDKNAKKSAPTKHMGMSPLQSNYTLCCRHQVGRKRKGSPTTMHYNRPWKHPTLYYYDHSQCNSLSISKCLSHVSTNVSSVSHGIGIG